MSTAGRSVFRTLNLLLAAGAAACAEPGTAPAIAQNISATSRSELGAPVLTPVPGRRSGRTLAAWPSRPMEIAACSPRFADAPSLWTL